MLTGKVINNYLEDVYRLGGPEWSAYTLSASVAVRATIIDILRYH
jgi:hypothetical protein